ncbi:hypothetical protein FOMPIDRAFT_1055055 [Fomitopsis schrenkii]|uniref:Uncharacterized protein n=1 Tax=Fomitopsis schrenkii TaxID=2126942 RepID=S8F6F7_FOMSC|nr:hypothetical protein FOMPIDRAFT_1055055 [Fomitopsis schrenkii]
MDSESRTRHVLPLPWRSKIGVLQPEDAQNVWEEGIRLMEGFEEQFSPRPSRDPDQSPESQGVKGVSGDADDTAIDPEFQRWIGAMSRLDLEKLAIRLRRLTVVQDQNNRVTSSAFFTLLYAARDITDGKKH